MYKTQLLYKITFKSRNLIYTIHENNARSLKHMKNDTPRYNH